MDGQFKSPPSKDAVRRLWCTEILAALQREIGPKYYYLGLPGPEAKDLQEWHARKLVGRVCAIQMLDTKGDDELASVTRLESFLAQTFGHMGIPYKTYLGLLEDIVINGKDARQREFRQEGFVTVYQLDFCHALTDNSWETVNVNLRYEAIRELIIRQSSQAIDEKCRPFVLFLTVRDEIATKALKEFIAEHTGGRETDLIHKLVKAHPIDESKQKQVRHPCLKAFVFSMLNNCFVGNNIRALFLPPVYYVGTGREHPMVVFAVLGAFDSLSAIRTKSLQSLGDYLSAEGFQLDQNRLVRASVSPLEKERAWNAPGIMKKYIDRFVADPVWKTLAREAQAIRLRPSH